MPAALRGLVHAQLHFFDGCASPEFGPVRVMTDAT
jgi:hypothetical protein